VERRCLSPDDVASIVAGERKELYAAAAMLDGAGRPVEAAGCRGCGILWSTAILGT
jgi:hypothetical protein